MRVSQVGAEQGAALSSTAQAVEAALRKGNLGNFTVVGTEIVGPAVGEELTQKGIWAFVLSLIGILAYIGSGRVRFGWRRRRHAQTSDARIPRFFRYDSRERHRGDPDGDCYSTTTRSSLRPCPEKCGRFAGSLRTS